MASFCQQAEEKAMTGMTVSTQRQGIRANRLSASGLCASIREPGLQSQSLERAVFLQRLTLSS